jgi:hypothetical protein
MRFAARAMPFRDWFALTPVASLYQRSGQEDVKSFEPRIEVKKDTGKIPADSSNRSHADVYGR